eukprot:TRINITY_DN1633_c0_g1_i1.p1 TRINITY_DN1633_c0_g1~~TRINITY_DN1633_c0_g1_i1.p1  ORF type:complete len:322 (+),score=81.54 TRINITY_DN1633_c0_g1_i1:142-1107(+)
MNLDPNHQLLKICADPKPTNISKILELINEKNADVNFEYIQGTNQKIEFYSTRFKIKKELFQHGTPLQISSYNGHLAMVNTLIQCKADVSLSSEDDEECPMFFACQNGHTEVAKLLLENKALVNQSTNENTNNIYMAAQNGYPDCVKLLAEYKADINQKRLNNSYPLYIACKKNHVETVSMILAYKGNVNLPGFNNLLPLQVTNNEEILEMLKHPHVPVINNLEKVVEELRDENQKLKHMIEVLNIDSSQDSPTIELGSDSTIELFLAHIKLLHYNPLFENEGFQLVEDLEGINSDDLITIGIANQDHRDLILKSFNSLDL